MNDARIYELAKQHLGGKGHDLIWQDDPRYAAAMDMPKDARWSQSSVRAEQTMAFARALLAEQRESIAREWDGCMAPMFDPAGKPTDPLDIGATIRGTGGVGEGGEPSDTADEDAYVIDKLARLLAEIAVIVKGPELPLHRHGYHDLPALVAELKRRADGVAGTHNTEEKKHG